MKDRTIVTQDLAPRVPQPKQWGLSQDSKNGKHRELGAAFGRNRRLSRSLCETKVYPRPEGKRVASLIACFPSGRG